MAYSFKDLAEEVLKAASVPMTPKEIWAEAERQGLTAKLTSCGKTPWQTLGAQLYRDVKKGSSRFISHGGQPKRFFLSVQKTVSPQSPVETTAFVAETPHYSFIECAQKVLKAVANREPMHYLDITKKALEQGWLQTDGKTPEASLYAQVLTHISKSQEKGKTPLFVKHGKGLVGLTEWAQSGFGAQVEKHNEDIRKQLLERLHRMEPAAFERLVQLLLKAMDFEETRVTPATKDGGIDVRGTWTFPLGIRQRFAIQVKRWKGNVQAQVVRAVRGSLTNEEQGLIVTTSDFSKRAREEAIDPKKHSAISLINGNQLVKLLIENDIPVDGIRAKKERLEVLELSKEDIPHATTSL